MNDDEKRAAALAAVREMRDGMLVGLGTGSTAAHAIRALGRRVADGLSIRAVATSRASEELARKVGIEVLDFANVATVDLTIDGADEIAPGCRVLKGAGGALVREKIVASASRRMVVIVDASKRVERLGKAALPVEVLPFARAYVARVLSDLCDEPLLRRDDKGEPYRTDNGNCIFDMSGWARSDPAAVARTLDAIPGIVGHGLFLNEVAAAYVADGETVTRMERSAASG